MPLSRSFLMSALICSLVGCSSSASGPKGGATAAQVPSAEATNTAPPDERGGIPGGGGCSYAEFPGSCEITGDGMMTFKGTVDDAPLVLAGNAFTRSDEPPANGKVGSTAPCVLKFETQGTCTPCELSFGWCGSAAWEACSAYGRRHAKPAAPAK